MTYPTTQEIEIWLNKAPENNPERYICDRAYEKGVADTMYNLKVEGDEQ